jgi:hypothetical protein
MDTPAKTSSEETVVYDPVICARPRIVITSMSLRSNGIEIHLSKPSMDIPIWKWEETQELAVKAAKIKFPELVHIYYVEYWEQSVFICGVLEDEPKEAPRWNIFTWFIKLFKPTKSTEKDEEN